jgi:hypothetical protein
MVPVQIGSGLCLLGVAGYVLTKQPEWFWLWVPGFPVAFLLMAYAQLFGICCPWCRANLKGLAFQRAEWSFDPRVRCCPYCARALDDELGDTTTTEDIGPHVGDPAEPDTVREPAI